MKLGNAEYESDVWRLVADATGYRLPTEAEWEYACRAGTTTEFASGSDEEMLRKYAVFQASRTASGGSKLPNGWGLFDMHGNVWEWCWDGYEKYDAKSPAVDPTGAAGVPNRVFRGGGWGGSRRDARSSYRCGSRRVPGLRPGFSRGPRPVLGIGRAEPIAAAREASRGAEHGSRSVGGRLHGCVFCWVKMDVMMAYRVFTLPVHELGAAETELNGLLANHRVVSVDRRFVEEGERSFWTFCVDFVDARRGSSSSSAAGGTWKARPDRLPRGAQRRGLRGVRQAARGKKAFRSRCLGERKVVSRKAGRVRYRQTRFLNPSARPTRLAFPFA